MIQIAPADANRRCGPPKPSGSYQTGFDSAAGGPPGGLQVPTRPRRAHGDAVVSRMCPYVNDALIRDSRAIRRDLLGPSCQNKVPMETCRKPIWLDGNQRVSTDRSTVPYQRTVDTRTHTGPYGSLACLDGAQPNQSTLTPDLVRPRATRHTGARPPHIWLAPPGVK